MSSSESPKDGKPSSKPFSLSLSGSGSNGRSRKSAFNIPPARAAEPPSRTLARRPHRLHDDESDEEEAPPAFEDVAGFDTHTGTVLSADGRAVDKEKRELVIPVTSKNNWRDRVRANRGTRGKNLLPKEVQAMQEAERRGETAENDQETDRPSMSYGLSFAKPSQGEETKPGEDQAMKDAGPLKPQVVDERKPLTQDEIALQALIRESKGETEGRTDLVIESAKREVDESYPVRLDETGSFRVDVASRPEPATLDQYNAIPVEEFGAALLRGMGWKEGQSIGRGKYGTSATDYRSQSPRIPERRPGFLGIGAKDVSGGKGAEAELGAWGRAAMRKGARKAETQGGEGNTQGVYMPVLMRNKKTGEYITEEELTALKKEGKAKKGDDDWRERRDRNLEKSGRMDILVAETITTMTAIGLTDGGRVLHGETEVCHPVIDSPGGESTTMKTAAGETTVIIATEIETETGAIVSGIKIETGIGIERGVVTGAADIGMMIGIARDIHPLMRLAGTDVIETAIETLNGEDMMINVSENAGQCFGLDRT
ncbi:spliceosome ATPase-activating subunit SPP2 [Aspergillus fumigatus Af293]|uniref:Pre-mRNA-splicing factor spp2 n=1 Tax=Aspergillus fumigatus (strain ATCC MYA-4609 / CBS 101355 / FGSC A1100 / Af293) TaxID=330879 RepID=SPP2_ASPFU|nr:G-patch domain protein (Spp2), putative [Aspergillus fumigatus Af293]Q4WP02.1 RecName: Full=Pre-mRNA-splicing factor spp2 [Aspergillus fumigatus Af293]EAL90032.1 G-patch domain protein (Spp2), putative [Aspergillus fumigatus Af293]